MQSLSLIGKACKDFRLSLGILQSEVARDTGYSIENVSKFENGNNNNLKIFMWYVQKGFHYDEENDL